MYGESEKSNKPSSSFALKGSKNAETDHKLQQKGVQTWILLRVFRFLTFDKVDTDDVYLKYLLSLNKITEIVMAPKLLPSTLSYLMDLLTQHYNEFNILFPNANKINKLDHIMHIPQSIK